jgi:Leucine-rich repeat (LRR) protein
MIYRVLLILLLLGYFFIAVNYCMEDLDEEPSLRADENGIVQLSHGSWVKLDEFIWHQGQSILVLNVEANQLVELPPALGNLVLLRVLNVAWNKLTSLPEEIGYCAQLLKLQVQNNFIKAIPKGNLNIFMQN